MQQNKNDSEVIEKPPYELVEHSHNFCEMNISSRILMLQSICAMATIFASLVSIIFIETTCFLNRGKNSFCSFSSVVILEIKKLEKTKKVIKSKISYIQEKKKKKEENKNTTSGVSSGCIIPFRFNSLNLFNDVSTFQSIVPRDDFQLIPSQSIQRNPIETGFNFFFFTFFLTFY